MAEKECLTSGFLRSVERFPQRRALEVEGESWAYRRLYERAADIAQTLDESAPHLTAVLAYRSATAFAGILASLLRGGGFVPLNPSFPVPRSRQMLVRSGCTSVIADRRGQAHVEELLDGILSPLRVILPDCPDVTPIASRWPEHQFVGAEEVKGGLEYEPRDVDPASAAYLLFTSGSTGIPKGVAVSHRSVRHFIDSVVKRYGITEDDRFSQMFDMTFDLSIFDMFAAWERGACVCCPSTQERNLPGPYIKKGGITIWFSVPSTGLQMQRLRMLQEGKYPALRLSLFCGEALTADLADAWSRAAPNSVVENLYGPTEATIACTVYRWDSRRSPSEVEHSIVPIGQPLPGLTARVVDESLNDTPPGEPGELLVAGPQVAMGYWQDPDATARAFVTLPGGDSVFYRTGDLVRRPRQPSQPLTYLGRIDHQIKIQGYRVEIGEIEAAVRAEAGVDVAVAVGWPRTPAGAEGIVVFLQRGTEIPGALTERLRIRLPHFMVPQKVVLLERLPLNANGKVDRKALLHHLDAGGEAHALNSLPAEERPERPSHR